MYRWEIAVVLSGDLHSLFEMIAVVRELKA